MTPRAEVVTMNEAGKAAFLMDLKRAKTRHAYSLPDTAAVDEHVAAWEAKQAAIVEEMRPIILAFAERSRQELQAPHAA